MATSKINYNENNIDIGNIFLGVDEWQLVEDKLTEIGRDVLLPKSLWSWGLNNYGRLGLNDTTNYSSPVQVGSLTNWKSVSCGNSHTLAIKN